MQPLFIFMQITFILGNKVDVKKARTNAVCLRGVKYYIIKKFANYETEIYSKARNEDMYEDESVAVFGPKYQSIKNRLGHVETCCFTSPFKSLNGYKRYAPQAEGRNCEYRLMTSYRH